MNVQILDSRVKPEPGDFAYLYDRLLGLPPAEMKFCGLSPRDRSKYSYLDTVVSIITDTYLDKTKDVSAETNFVLSMIRLSGANGPKRGFTTLVDSNLNLFIKPRLTTQDIHYSTDSIDTRFHKCLHRAKPNLANGIEDGKGSRLSVATIMRRAARIPTKQYKQILGARKPLARNRQTIRLNRVFLERNGLAQTERYGGWEWKDRKITKWANTLNFTNCHRTDRTVIDYAPGLKEWAARCINFIESNAGMHLFAHHTPKLQRYSVIALQMNLARDLRITFGLPQPIPASPRKRKNQPVPMTDEQIDQRHMMRGAIKMLSYTVPGLEALPTGIAAKIVETKYPTITPEDLKPTTFLPKIIEILKNKEELWRLRWAIRSDPLIHFLYYLKLITTNDDATRRVASCQQLM